jgi:hypothetical protein
VTSTTLRITRLDGGTLVLEAVSLAWAFFVSAGFEEFDRGAMTTDPDRIETPDVVLLNQVMRARTAHANWESFVGAPLPFLAAIPHDLDLIASSDAEWEQADGERLIRDALDALVGSRRGLAVVTKLLHLKRPRLFPILDRLTVEMLGSSIPLAAQSSGVLRVRVSWSCIFASRAGATSQRCVQLRNGCGRRRSTDRSFVSSMPCCGRPILLPGERASRRGRSNAESAAS